jgi:hypothetical protein
LLSSATEIDADSKRHSGSGLASHDTIVIDSKPEAPAIARATTALVVVDMQNAYLSKSG